LSIGMTYDQYWNGDVVLTKYYRKAFDMQNERRNQEMWTQGAYFYAALCSVAPILHAFSKATKPQPYLDQPFPLTANKAEDRKEAEAKKHFEKQLDLFVGKAMSINKQKRGDS